MQVQFNQYKYNYNYFPVKYAKKPSFQGVPSTMQEKLAVLLEETKRLYKTNPNAGIKDFEAIIKKISPTTSVKPFSEIPPGSNISPRAGAYFSQITDINSLTNEMIIKDKIIYLNFNNHTTQPKLKVFSDFIHEATHIAQEESTDKLSTIDFTKRMLYSSASAIEKNHSLVGGIQGFKSVEYNIQLPLIEVLRKADEMPRRVPYANKYSLNIAYQSMTGLPTQELIKAVTKDILKQLKIKLPFADDNYMLQYIHKKAGHEKDAYKTSLDFLKDILNIKGDTDLDLRILLYDDFEKAVESMIRNERLS